MSTRARSTEGLVGPGRKTGIEAQAADCYYALPVLGNAEVRGVDLSEVNPISRREKRFQEFANVSPSANRQETLDILEDERLRAVFGHGRRE